MSIVSNIQQGVEDYHGSAEKSDGIEVYGIMTSCQSRVCIRLGYLVVNSSHRMSVACLQYEGQVHSSFIRPQFKTPRWK